MDRCVVSPAPSPLDISLEKRRLPIALSWTSSSALNTRIPGAACDKPPRSNVRRTSRPTTCTNWSFCINFKTKEINNPGGAVRHAGLFILRSSSSLWLAGLENRRGRRLFLCQIYNLIVSHTFPRLHPLISKDVFPDSNGCSQAGHKHRRLTAG